jgi:hypothetical protein
MAAVIVQLVQAPAEYYAAFNDNGQLFLNPVISIALVQEGNSQSILPVVSVEGVLQPIDETSEDFSNYLGTVFKNDKKNIDNLEELCANSGSKK